MLKKILTSRALFWEYFMKIFKKCSVFNKFSSKIWPLLIFEALAFLNCEWPTLIFLIFWTWQPWKRRQTVLARTPIVRVPEIWGGEQKLASNNKYDFPNQILR